MIKIVVVEKTGLLKDMKINKDQFQILAEEETLKFLSKKAGFKTSNDFEHACTWEFEEISVMLYGKLHGRANTENKYDFPPPVDELLFFGNCVLISTSNNDKTLSDLNVETWKELYDELFGGFEDLVSETSSEDELDNIPDIMKTEEGYLKDDFVVDNNAIDYDEDNDTSSKSICDDNNEEDEESELSEDCFLYSDEEEYAK